MFDWNWFQCMENNMDTAHQGILHFGAVTYEDAIDPEMAQKAYPGPVEDLKYIVRQPRAALPGHATPTSAAATAPTAPRTKATTTTARCTGPSPG